MDALEKPTNTM